MQSIVAIDIETTGLNDERDAVIEIGAVKFKGHRVEDEWSTLVNPGRHIPEFITALTGISDAEVRHAPRLRDIAHELEAFVGNAPVVGHNIRFDLGFLQKQAGVLQYNEIIDTYELAAVVMPTASRYNLGALGKQLGILLPATHRALDDARVTMAAFNKLIELVRELPLDLLAEIVRHGEVLEWDANWAFQEVLRSRAKEGIKAKKAQKPTHFFDEEKYPPLDNPEEPIPLNEDEVASILEYGGPFSHYFESFEQRPEQIAMLRAVANALSHGTHLMVEAGTGVGKCLTGDAWVTFKSGERRQIGELVAAGTIPAEPILSVTAGGKLTYQNIKALHNNGQRPVWKLKTGLGRKITATANHPFLTFNGWQTLGELKVGDRIATIRSLPAGALSHPLHEAFVIGAMIGDGGLGYPDSLSFTNFDVEVIEAFRQSVEKLGNVKMTQHKATGHYGFRRLSLMGHERSGLNVLLEKLDLLGRDARTKTIPPVYFLADQETISALLAGLWVTDGCIETSRGNISISSASEQLISDIQHLLLRLGIIARVRYKPTLLKGKRFDSWHLAILDIHSKRTFWQTVGRYMVGKRKRSLDAWHDTNGKRKHNPNDDLLPVQAWEYINQERRRMRASWHEIRTACTVSSDRSREISRDKMLAIGNYLMAPALMEMATSDLYWDRIVAIEPAGEAETFDLTMDGEPNFVANDIVVHNSFAYLIPAALFALQNNTRVVVSTNTINLQDQLTQRDLPNLSQALNLDFRFSVLKGRSNYLCPRKLENMRHYGPKNADEMRVLAKVLVWQLNNSSGDRSEINLTGPTEREVWNQLSAEDDACTTETCIKRTGGACPFYRAKTASQSAHVLVVNHALLLSDVATGSKVLPEYSHLIIDEGHHLEAATTNALSFKLSQFDLERMMKEVGGTNSGVLGRLLAETSETLRPSDLGLLQQKVSRATDKAFRIEQMNREFFNVLGEFARIQREGQPQSNYAWQMRILPATRTLPYWDEVEMAWDVTGETLRNLLTDLGEIYKAAGELYAEGHDELEDVMGDISNITRRLTEAEANITGMISKPNAGTVYWIEVQPNQNRLSLNAAPLSVAGLVEKYLWHEKRSVILTSATLTAHGEFQYLRNVLGADEADEMQLGSPFDYESAALLYIANDIPEPNQNGYEQALNKIILHTAKATGGRMLVLFTSYAALKKTAQAITAPLAREEIYVYEQGDGASPNALLESFKTTERAVLLGTKSFWEGVDVPGEALSVVVITKLPFDVPTDPLIAARSEMYEDPFNQYYLPEAILKFRQGFGRLIRTQSDRGVVAILDRRVLTKQYGRLFLESLPQCTAKQGPAANLPREAARWLGM
ncbi:MAG: helicase C-terminal domain-containing protein [Chloroflexota bacterium]